MEKLCIRILPESISFPSKKVLVKSNYGHCYYDVDEDEGACIYGLYVIEEHRRRGHARELLCASIDAIRGHKYNGPIGVEALPSEKSIQRSDLIKFYEGLGLMVV